MRRNDWIRYRGVAFPKFYSNKNLAYVIACIAYKYGMTCRRGDSVIPKMAKAKLFIVSECSRYFKDTKISLRQIDALLYPQKMRFPYTAIVIIETIYNLLKEDDWDEEWKSGLYEYLTNHQKEDCRYEKFMLGDISEIIAQKKEAFMKSEYKDIYTGFIHSRELYFKKIDDVSMSEHCVKNFPSNYFSEEDIPKSIYDYQNQRVYMKERE